MRYVEKDEIEHILKATIERSTLDNVLTKLAEVLNCNVRTSQWGTYVATTGYCMNELTSVSVQLFPKDECGQRVWLYFPLDACGSLHKQTNWSRDGF